jgi:mannose-6-phosphate isomerase-like protein (cupin superfamily)
MKTITLAMAVSAIVSGAITSAQRGGPAGPPLHSLPLAQRIAHTDPAKARRAPSVHVGAGPMNIQSLFENDATDTNLWFLHRGTIEPKGGIGAHFHNQCEEMFIILDGEAQFTIDGQTSIVKGPAGAPVRMGHSHAIYNPTDRPVQWMNINVSALKGHYDAFNLDDPRVGVPLEPIPNFMVARFDRALLRDVNAFRGGKGTVQGRRVLDGTVFLANWGYLDHILIPPGASIGPSAHPEIGGFYYVLAGGGRVTVGSETASIKAHDAVPLSFNQASSFENTGTAPLELIAVGVVKDAARRMQTVGPTPFPGRGAPPPARGTAPR